jgi:hypothetical protein
MTEFRETVASYWAKVRDPETRLPCKDTIKAHVRSGLIRSIKFGQKRLLETPEATQRRLAAEQGVLMPDQPNQGAINGPTAREQGSVDAQAPRRVPAIA